MKLQTYVTVTIHGTEIDLIAEGGAICAAEPDVGISYRYIEGWSLCWEDGTGVPAAMEELVSRDESDKIQIALNEALSQGYCDPDPDNLREQREETRLVDLSPNRPPTEQ